MDKTANQGALSVNPTPRTTAAPGAGAATAITSEQETVADATQPSKRRPPRWPYWAGIGATITIIIWLLWGGPGIEAITIPTVKNWWWAALSVLAFLLVFPASAITFLAASPVKVPFSVAVVTQVASASTKLVAPAASGVIGLNVRVLSRHGVPVTLGLASVGAAQLAQFLATLASLVLVLPAHPSLLALFTTPKWLLGGAIAVAVLALILAVALREPRLAKHRERLRETAVHLAHIARSPRRALGLAAGGTLLISALWVSLWCCARALDSDVTYFSVVLALVAGSTLGLTVPTPGGLGGVEGSMVAAMVAAQTPAALAVPTVLLFRVITFWLPLPFGAIALAWLGRRRAI